LPQFDFFSYWGPDAMQKTVLIVEDETDVVDLLRYNLSKAGFGVLIANDGLKGLEIARMNRPDVVVLDLLLPKMNGYAVYQDGELGTVRWSQWLAKSPFEPNEPES
jgi:response regulator RpfG family c-di-GMP phosphodiesterase